jgi:hypothetical protein
MFLFIIVSTSEVLLERNRFDYDLINLDSDESSDKSSKLDSQDNSSKRIALVKKNQSKKQTNKDTNYICQKKN